MSDNRKAPIRIGLADDNIETRTVLTRMLERLGYEVSCAVNDGVELLQWRDAAQLDVVLVDLDMPGLDGLATAEEMSDNDVPVILISGHPDIEQIIVDNEPIVAALTKPVTAPALENAVKQALAGS